VRVRVRVRVKEISMNMLSNMNAKSSMRPKLMFKTRMTVRMFRMTVAIPKTMTISRTMRRSEDGISSFIVAGPLKNAFISSSCCSGIDSLNRSVLCVVG